MAHFAELDRNNFVVRVIVVDDDVASSEADGISFCKELFGSETRWKQTSYRGRIRKSYAGIGYRYDEVLDEFVAPFIPKEDQEPAATTHSTPKTPGSVRQ